MGKTIKIDLSDAQYAALSAEAEALGRPLFGHCRDKLAAATVASPAQPKRPVIVPQFTQVPEMSQAAPTPPADDRIARIEDAVARLTDYVMGQAAPEAQQPSEPLDVDSIVNAQFAQAEAAGLTEHIPDVEEELMLASGVRPISRRPVPFSAHGGPKHLQQLLG